MSLPAMIIDLYTGYGNDFYLNRGISQSPADRLPQPYKMMQSQS